MNKNAALTQQHEKQTLTFEYAGAPVTVDVWEPLAASGAAPILLIHGWGGTGGYWEQTAQALSATTRVIVPDLPGTGRSQPVPQARNMHQQVDALVFLLEQLQVDRMQIVGHSMGGAMALLLADRLPAQVERVVLTSLCFFLTETQEQIYKAAMFLFKLSLPFRAKWMVNVPFASQMMATRYFYRIPKDEAVLRQGLLDYLELDAATAVACADDATDSAIPEAGARLQAPALLIACRQDQVMPIENVDYTLSVIPNCDVRWIDQCGHLPMVEKPQEYLAILQEFIQL